MLSQTDVLMTADPKASLYRRSTTLLWILTVDTQALQHIMHKSGYNYAKTTQAQVSVMNITGRSILWAPCKLECFVLHCSLYSP